MIDVHEEAFSFVDGDEDSLVGCNLSLVEGEIDVVEVVGMKESSLIFVDEVG